jgi:hypothetical protein
MKPTYVVTLLLLTTLPALPQDRQPARACRLETKYDRVTDTTTVQCDELVGWGEAPAGLTVQANASFHGKEPNETAKFWLSLSANKGGATRHTRPLFQEAKTLYLVMDAAQMEIPVTDYRHDFYELAGLMAEAARAEIRSEDLHKLIEAKSLAGKWGNVEFKFSGAALASLKGFISRQVFATHAG